jgi:integrase
MQFEAYAEEFYELEAPSWKPKTAHEYRQVLNSRLLPAFGEKNLEAITRQDVRRFQNSLKSEGLSANSINTYVAILKVFLSGAVKDGHLKENPALNVKRESGEAKEIQILSLDEIKKVLAAADEHTRPLLTFLAYQGVRPSEAFGLRWVHVDFEEDKIKIKTNRVEGTEGTPKTKAGRRTVEMLPPVRDALLSLQAKSTSEYVFVTTNGKPYNRTIDYAWHKALRVAGLAPRKLYSLRHSYGSICLSNGVDALTVSHMMGHADPRITLSIYAHYLRNDESLDKMKALLT